MEPDSSVFHGVPSSLRHFRWSKISQVTNYAYSDAIPEDFGRGESDIETIYTDCSEWKESAISRTSTAATLRATVSPYAQEKTRLRFIGSFPARHPRFEVLSPQLAFLWLRSRLSTEDKEYNDTLLTVSWWQPVPMRLLPLTSTSEHLSYRVHRGPPIARCNATACWKQISVRRPSDRQIDQACDQHQLVYLRTSNIQNVIDLKNGLQQYHSYHRFHISSIFPYAQDTWEVLVNRKYADSLKKCAEDCRWVVENQYHPAMPTKPSPRFDGYMRAQERLMARAVFSHLIAGKSRHGGAPNMEDEVASIYSKLVELYRCYDASEDLFAVQPVLDIAALSPGWSCVIGFSCYNSVDADTVKHDE